MKPRVPFFLSAARRGILSDAPVRLGAILSASVILLVLAGCHKNATSAQRSGPVLKWQFKSSCSGVTHPALGSDGTLYFGCSNGLYAISPAGQLIWQTPLATPGTPVLASDGSIYVDIMHGLLFGYSPEGKMDWRPQVGMTGFGAPPALGPDNTLYLLNSVSDVFAFKPPRTDSFEWTRNTFRQGLLSDVPPLPGEARNGMPYSGSEPLIARDQSILVPRQNWLHSLSPSGEDQWAVELTPGSLEQAAIADDGTIYVGDDESVLYAVDSSGSKKWSFDAEAILIGSPVIDTQGTVYFVAGKSLYAVSPDGALQWKTAGLTPLFTPPAIAADGTLYVGGETTLYAVNPDGSLKWTMRVMAPTSAPSIGPDGTIYFACGYFWMCAVQDSGSPLMQSAWPKQFHDSRNTSSVLTGM